MGKRLGSGQICGSFICNVAKTRSRSCLFTQLSLILASHLLLWHSAGIYPWCSQAAWQLLYPGGSAASPPLRCVLACSASCEANAPCFCFRAPLQSILELQIFIGFWRPSSTFSWPTCFLIACLLNFLQFCTLFLKFSWRLEGAARRAHSSQICFRFFSHEPYKNIHAVQAGVVQRSGFLHSLLISSYMLLLFVVFFCVFFFFFPLGFKLFVWEDIQQWGSRGEDRKALWKFHKGVLRAESSARRGQSIEPKRRTYLFFFVGFDRSERLRWECYILFSATSRPLRIWVRAAQSLGHFCGQGASRGFVVFILWEKKKIISWILNESVVFYPGTFGMHWKAHFYPSNLPSGICREVKFFLLPGPPRGGPGLCLPHTELTSFCFARNRRAYLHLCLTRLFSIRRGMNSCFGCWWWGFRCLFFSSSAQDALNALHRGPSAETASSSAYLTAYTFTYCPSCFSSPGIPRHPEGD